MRIKDMMTKNPITVQADASVLNAVKLMKDHQIRRLPVVEKGYLVGIVAQSDLLEALPLSSAHGRRIGEIMQKNPVTVTPDTLLEDALRMGQKKKSGSFPVVDYGRLVGIATESDIVRYLVQAFDIGGEGSRITVKGPVDKVGEFQRMISIVKYHGIHISSMFFLLSPAENEKKMVLRLTTSDPGPIVRDFKKAGFNVV